MQDTDVQEFEVKQKTQSDSEYQRAFSMWSLAQPLYSLPKIVFASGLEFSGISPACGKCGHSIQKDHVRGEMRQLDPKKCYMSATSYCETCQALHDFEFLIEDGDPPKISEMSPISHYQA